MSKVPDLRAVRDGFREHDVMTSASAIAFHVLFTIVPLGLVALALAGFLSLEELWTNAATELRPQMSDAAYTVLDDTVTKVLTSKQPFWLTAGFALAIWRMSAAMRAVMAALDRIYDADRERPLRERLRVSITLALAVTALLLLALAVVRLGDALVPTEGALLGALSFLVRWGLATVLLALAVGLTIRHAPATPQPLGWVSFGTGVAVVTWVAGSALFGLYVTEVASYGSLFGSFATIVVLLTYLYLSAIALLAAAEVDTQVRRQVDGSPSGHDGP